MTKHKKRQRINKLRLAGVFITLILTTVGVRLLISSHAQSPSSSIQTESGSITPPASIYTDPNSSGGGAVLFGSKTIGPAGTYVDIYLPASNLTNVDEDLTINNVPNLGSTDLFWSHQLYFMSGPSGQGAYIGLQGINRAIFSVFDWASAEASPICSVQTSGFDGGTGPGTSCVISYPVIQGDTYRLSVKKGTQDSNGINWIGTVMNVKTGKSTEVASVNVDATWGNLSDVSIVWTEDFGPTITSCSQLPLSDVTFSNFTANNLQYTGPSSHIDQIGQSGCSSYSKITDINSGSFQEQMGLKP